MEIDWIDQKIAIGKISQKWRLTLDCNNRYGEKWTDLKYILTVFINRHHGFGLRDERVDGVGITENESQASSLKNYGNDIVILGKE